MDKPTLHIIKIGGKLINEPELLSQALASISKLTEPTIVVHGGGRQATALCKSLGIPVQMIDGRRITDGPTLEVAIMVYAGLTNKRIVAQLHSLGRDAIGVSGADADLIRSIKRPPHPRDYGWVGDVTQVNAKRFGEFISQGLLPVCCALTHDGHGQMLNTNADTIAAEIAKAMAEHYQAHLSYCFEHEGVLTDVHDPYSVVSKLTSKAFQQMINEGSIHTGMIPKLSNGFDALSNGAHQVKICGISGLDNPLAGTQLRSSL